MINCLILGAIALLSMGILRGERSVKGYVDLRQSRDVLQSAVEALEIERNDLQLEISKLKNSPEYARKVLRDKYHLLEDSEDIVFFADE